MLTVKSERGFTVKNTADSDAWRRFPAMTFYKSAWMCFVIGAVSDLNSEGSVSRYNITVDRWVPGTPNLQVARRNASACTLGDFVFVFAGLAGNKKCINSIEMLKVTAIDNGAASWELIELPKAVFTPRSSPVVIPVNISEIVILGGKDTNGNLSDILVFNTYKKTCNKVSDGGS